ncbi:uncharacterized protein F4817DRAFT_326512 [Daldinia loculata]|uniref:uncharacterized protein n=1 Tax=Daldinia loculata TaxID=103429 RepID=UPI0020C3DC5D|nr:uncharacterized protein F4817DRAFT_326512 [Daldinia loculata]KAI1651020.1 hypothetical protein F4817DRAFT_326512 [Daldinia loculata]
MVPEIPIQNHFKEPGAGRSFFMVSWSFSSAQLDRLIEYLKEEETTFEELQTWSNFITSRNNLGPNARLTVRYISSGAGPSDAPLPLTIAQMMEDEFINPFCGVLPEFLEAVNVALPDVARDVQMHILPDFFSLVHNNETRFWHRLVYQALLVAFDLESLINRDLEPPLVPQDLPRGEFSLLNTVYRGGMPSTLISNHLVHIQNRARQLFQQMYRSSQSGNNLDIFPRAMTVEALNSLILQATPFELEGERPVLIFAVKGVPPGDLFNSKMYLEGETSDVLLMKTLIEEVMLDGRDTDFHGNIVPFYCFAPFYRRFSPGYIKEFTAYMWDYVRATRPVVFVTLGKRMAEVVHRAFCTDPAEDSESIPIHELGLGSPRIITLTGSGRSREGPFSFIHIPLLDPGRYMYTMTPETREVFLAYMTYSFEYVVLVADTAKIFRDEMESSGGGIDEGSAQFCQEVILRVRRRLRSTLGRPFVEGIRKAKFDIAELITQEPIMFC